MLRGKLPVTTLNSKYRKTCTTTFNNAEFTDINSFLIHQTVEVDPKTYCDLLQKCIKKGNGSLHLGKLVHAHMIQSGFNPLFTPFTATKLLIFYARCGILKDARQLFDKMRSRNPVPWTTLIAAYARQGLAEEAWEIFHGMRDAGVEPDEYAYASVLSACVGDVAVERGRKLHEEVLEMGYINDVFVCSSLIDMYVKSGNTRDARNVFDKMPSRDLVIWTAMIRGYTQIGEYEEALRLYCSMQGHGSQPNALTFTAAVKACASLRCLDYGKRVHLDVVRVGAESNMFVCNGLIDMYSKCGEAGEARVVFDRMASRNDVSWCSMISGYLQNCMLREAMELFEKADCSPDFVPWATMISGYMRNGLVDKAFEIFERMPEGNPIAWTAMITGCVQNGYVEKSRRLFREMYLSKVTLVYETFAGVLPVFRDLSKGMELHAIIIKKGFGSEMYVASALMEMYARCGNLESTHKTFEEMTFRDALSWNALIAAYVQIKDYENAFAIFQDMVRLEVKPISNTFAVLLSACARLASLHNGFGIHGYVMKVGFISDVYVGSALVDMYAKCGSIENAHEVFLSMPLKDVVIWNAMIAGHALHGNSKAAISLFEEMCANNVKPDDVSFLGVLSSCCHAGLVDKGKQYFNLMTDVYHLTPSLHHYGSMVDLLGRAGLLTEAMYMIKKMRIEPDVSIWGSLLSACATYNNVELGEYAAKHLFALDPSEPSYYVALSNLYAAVGRWEDVEKIRALMKDAKLAKSPGASWIEVNKQVPMIC